MTKKEKKKEEEKEEDKWWLKESSKGTGSRWKTLVHNGVMFPAPYVPHNVKMLYEGKPVNLTPEQEEAATFYAQVMEREACKRKQFQDNFFTDLKKMLGRVC
jgi:DNA topoisomerase-1